MHYTIQVRSERACMACHEFSRLTTGTATRKPPHPLSNRTRQVLETTWTSVRASTWSSTTWRPATSGPSPRLPAPDCGSLSPPPFPPFHPFPSRTAIPPSLSTCTQVPGDGDRRRAHGGHGRAGGPAGARFHTCEIRIYVYACAPAVGIRPAVPTDQPTQLTNRPTTLSLWRTRTDRRLPLLRRRAPPQAHRSQVHARHRRARGAHPRHRQGRQVRVCMCVGHDWGCCVCGWWG